MRDRRFSGAIVRTGSGQQFNVPAAAISLCWLLRSLTAELVFDVGCSQDLSEHRRAVVLVHVPGEVHEARLPAHPQAHGQQVSPSCRVQRRISVTHNSLLAYETFSCL